MSKKIEVGRVGNGIRAHKFTKSEAGLVPLCMIALFVTDDVHAGCNDAENATEGTEADVTCKTCRKMMEI